MKQRIKGIGKRIGADLWNAKEALLAFTAYYIIVHAIYHAFCPLVILTGFPCAGCGMTRAVFFMLTGQFVRSWNLNPMALPVILFIGYCVICRYILGKRIKGWKTGLIIIGIAMLAVYVCRMYTVFPERPPYVYTGGSFLERYVPGYREILHRLLGI